MGFKVRAAVGEVSYQERRRMKTVMAGKEGERTSECSALTGTGGLTSCFVVTFR